METTESDNETVDPSFNGGMKDDVNEKKTLGDLIGNSKSSHAARIYWNWATRRVGTQSPVTEEIHAFSIRAEKKNSESTL